MSLYSVVCFGEILWDVLPSGAKPGGAPMNVAYHLQKLGLTPAVITRVGNDERGDTLLSLLKSNDLATDYIQSDETQPTGVVLAHLNEKAEATYDIISPVAWDFIEANDAIQTLVAQTPYFVFGSLAARQNTTRHTLFQLLESAHTKVLDINLRAPHFSKSNLEALLHQCTILKINDAELPLISAWYGPLKKLEDQMAQLQDRFKINTIVTTKGSAGAVLNKDGKMYTHPGYKVQVQDTVGSGDAFLAALLYKLNANATPDDALAFANALGAFVASQAGAWPDYKVEDVITKMQTAIL